MGDILRSVGVLLDHMGERKRKIRLAYPLIFFESFMRYLPFGLMGLILRRLSENRLDEDLIYLVLGVVCLGIVIQCTMKFFADRLQKTQGLETFSEKRLEILKHLRRLPLGFYSDAHMGQVASILGTDMTFLEEYGVHQISIAVVGIANLLMCCFWMMVFVWRVGLVYLLLLLVSTGLNERANRRQRLQTPKRQASFGDMSTEILNFVRGLPTIKAFNMERERSVKVYDAIERTREIAMEMVEGVKHDLLLERLTRDLMVPMLCGLSIFLISRHQMDLATGLILCFFSIILRSPLQALGAVAEVLPVTDAALERMDQVFEHEILQDRGHSVPRSNVITFEDVSFSYEGEEEALSHIHLTIPEKSFTALVGHSGSGKSTLVNLIARFWDVSSGKVCIGGVDVRDIAFSELMDRVSMVFQRTYLFHDTVAENIAMGNPSMSRQEIVEAAKRARAHEFIMNLPQGYDTILAEGGGSLSGGERQRIAIARAIAKDAPIVLLDEATAGIDPENELWIQEAFEELIKEKTLVVIAHRLDSIQGADQILVLDHGRIVEGGTHEELLEKKGVYEREYRIYEELRKDA